MRKPKVKKANNNNNKKKQNRRNKTMLHTYVNFSNISKYRLYNVCCGFSNKYD